MEITLSDFTDKEIFDHLFLRLGLDFPAPDENGVIEFQTDGLCDKENPKIRIEGYYGIQIKICFNQRDKITEFIIDSAP